MKNSSLAHILFGVAAIITSCGFLLRSIPFADAYPQGPNINMGGSPYFAVHYSSYAAGDVFTNNTSMVAIITDIHVAATSYSCTRTFSITNTTDMYSVQSAQGAPTQVSLVSGIKVPPGETLSTTGGNYCQGTSISGYYAHP